MEALKKTDRIARSVRCELGRMETKCGLSHERLKETLRAIEIAETNTREAKVKW